MSDLYVITADVVFPRGLVFAILTGDKDSNVKQKFILNGKIL